MKKRLNINKIATVGGVFVVAFFALCMTWGLLLIDPVLIELHFNLLQIAFPGFSWSLGGIVIGAIEAFAYGWFFGALLAWLCRKICIWQSDN